MIIPSPREVGLPPQFDKWRDGQREAISVTVTSDRRVVALSAPTGFGKSACVVAAALLSGVPTCIITDSKGLQDQYTRIYGSIGMVDLRGRRNYKCSLKDDYTCEEGYAFRCPFKGSISCPASQAEIRAACSSLVVTNYDKWTSSRKYGLGMTHFQQVIFDEGHAAPEALARAMQITLNHKEVEETMGFPFLTGEDALNMRYWKGWAARARERSEWEMRSAHDKCLSVSDPKITWVKHYSHMKKLCKRLGVLSTCRPEDWIVDELPDGFQFDPIRPARYSEGALLLRLPKIVIVSATLRPKTLAMIGLAKADYEFKEFDSDFDKTRCPTYYVPTMRVDNRAKDLSPLWIRLDQILARRRDRKGIIHTISYARRDDIVGLSRFAGNMLINQRGEPTMSTIQEFKVSPPGTILVSPSVGTGYDFPGSECEFQFMCKIPFPDGRSKIVKARQEDDKEYGAYHAMQQMVQSFGRGMRSKSDRCENFIGDMHLDWFIPKFGHLAPKSFYAFFRRVEILPQPPERL